MLFQILSSFSIAKCQCYVICFRKVYCFRFLYPLKISDIKLIHYVIKFLLFRTNTLR
jgi:hypothetical protein